MKVPRSVLKIEEPHEDETGASTAKRAQRGVLKFTTTNTRRFQCVPSRTEKGGTQLPGDVRDYERRVTLDLDSQDIVEDASTEELAKWGHTEKLPVNVRNIRTFYGHAPVMGAKRARNLTCLSVKGGAMKAVLKQLGVRQEFAKTHAKCVGAEVAGKSNGPGKASAGIQRATRTRGHLYFSTTDQTHLEYNNLLSLSPVRASSIINATSYRKIRYKNRVVIKIAC